MLTCIDVKFIFDTVRLSLSSSANILQIADVALRVENCHLAVFAMFLTIISPISCCSSYSWNEWNVRHFFITTKTTQPRRCQLILDIDLYKSIAAPRKKCGSKQNSTCVVLVGFCFLSQKVKPSTEIRLLDRIAPMTSQVNMTSWLVYCLTGLHRW